MEAQERRKYKRIGLESSLVIKRIDSNGDDEQVNIQIYNISKAGLGFYCLEPLQMNAIYDAHITIWTKEVIPALIRIVRIELQGDGYEYGATFLGLSDIDAYRISVYEAVEKAKQEQHS